MVPFDEFRMDNGHYLIDQVKFTRCVSEGQDVVVKVIDGTLPIRIGCRSDVGSVEGVSSSGTQEVLICDASSSFEVLSWRKSNSHSCESISKSLSNI